MDIFITIIIGIILLLICSVICFYLGKRSHSKEIRLHNEDILQQRILIEQELQNKALRNQQLDVQYNNKLSEINNAQQNAYKNYEEWITTLQEDYQQKQVAEQTKFNQYKESIQEQVDKYNKDLASLKSTYAIAVETFQREQQVENTIDDYRLNIGRNEENDIQVLESVKPRLSKPRILSMLIWQTYYQPLAKQKITSILGSDTVCGIYKITNTKDKKCYIGQAVDVRKRWTDHMKCGLGIDTPQGNKLYQAMQQDGLQNFTFELLEECNREELNGKEKFYIDMFNSCDFGYNSIKGNN